MQYASPHPKLAGIAPCCHVGHNLSREGRNRKIHHLKASREDSYQAGNSTRVLPSSSRFFKPPFPYGLLIHELYLP